MTKRRSGLVSVVIVNFRGADDTITAVRTLREQSWPAVDLEIIVVENGSGDDSSVRLEALGDSITLVVSEANLGFTGGCNLGVEQSHGEIIAFLNNDARPDPEWIATAMKTLSGSPDIGAIASKVLDWEGERVDYVGAAITWYGMGYKPHAGETDQHAWDDERDVLFPTGAAMFIRADLFERLNGFDDNFFMFYDDVDLGWRLNLLGYRVRYQPKSLVFHKHHASMSKFGDFREQYLLERNALYCLYKNLDDESLAVALPGATLLALRRSVARGGLDSTVLDLRNPGDDAQLVMPVPKATMAGVFAIDQFVEMLPQMAEQRARIQSTRVTSDRELSHLFGRTDEPAFPIEYYLAGYEKIANSLGLLELPPRRRVLVITGDPVGIRMAGPAIRAFNIARLLAREHDVRLISTSSAVSGNQDFFIGKVNSAEHGSMDKHEEWADIIIVQGHALQHFPTLERSTKILVVDIYDPLHLEQLEQGRELEFSRWNDQVNESTAALNHQMLLGDFFLCASERQRHFWLGQLAALGRVNVLTYSRDNDLESLITVAPFGIASADPVSTAPAMRGVIPGIGFDDKLIIWGGGVYSWFDPETLIRSVARLAETHANVRLVFLGIKHPNPAVPEMDVVARCRILARQLGVADKNVFFNESWVPYDDRQNYLLEADLGVSTHFQHVETTFSFRTRILDYLWVGLPIVSTAGDSFGDLVERENLGASVPEKDVDALRQALETFLYDEKAIAQARANVARIREDFTWDRSLGSLMAFCRNPLRAADRGPVTNREGVITRALPSRATRTRRAQIGLRRDLDRVAYYLGNGGVKAVVERFLARRARLRG